MTLAEQICTSLKNEPENWTHTGYTLIHKDKDIHLWVANGYWFYGCENGSRIATFGLIEKVHIMLAHRAWNKRPLVSE